MTKLLCSLLALCCVMTAASATEPSSIDDWLNPMLYPKDSRPFDKSITSWAELNWQWIYAQPFAHNRSWIPPAPIARWTSMGRSGSWRRSPHRCPAPTRVPARFRGARRFC